MPTQNKPTTRQDKSKDQQGNKPKQNQGQQNKQDSKKR